MLNEVYNRRILELAAGIPRLGRLNDPDATATAAASATTTSNPPATHTRTYAHNQRKTLPILSVPCAVHRYLRALSGAARSPALRTRWRRRGPKWPALWLRKAKAPARPLEMREC